MNENEKNGNLIVNNISNELFVGLAKYKRIDCEVGYLTDEVEIKNFSIGQKQDVMVNGMLGDFNQNGDYIIEKNVLKGLVSLRKKLLTSYNNIYFCESEVVFAHNKKLQFCIVLKEPKLQSENATAVLKLMENVNHINGYVQNTNTFVVASYSDAFDSNFYIKMKKVFNIIEVLDNDGRDKQEDIDVINARLNYILAINTESSLPMEQIEKQYYLARIEILKTMGAEDTIVAFDALKKKTGVFVEEGSPNYYRNMNQILDQAIDITCMKDEKRKIQFAEVFKDVDNKHFSEVINVVDNAHKAVESKKENIVINKVQNVPKQEKDGRSASSGGNGKAKSSSSGSPAKPSDKNNKKVETQEKAKNVVKSTAKRPLTWYSKKGKVITKSQEEAEERTM